MNAPIRNAHRITKPDGSSVIAVTGVEGYRDVPGYTVRQVRGYDDPHGRGFVVTEEIGGETR